MSGDTPTLGGFEDETGPAGCWPFCWCVVRGGEGHEVTYFYGSTEDCRRVAVLRGPGACRRKGGGWSLHEVRIHAEAAADYLRGTRKLLGRLDTGPVWSLPATDFLPPPRPWPAPSRWRPRLAWRPRFQLLPSLRKSRPAE